MFDTVRLCTQVDITPSKLEKLPHITCHHSPSRADNTTYTLKPTDNDFGFTYNTKSSKLRVELSIPKFLYGDNSQQLILEDLQSFYKDLNFQLSELLDVSLLPIQAWDLTRMDVYYDFRVGRFLKDYIRALSALNLPNLKRRVDGNNETVTFSNTNARIKCYDKHQQCLDRKLPSNNTLGILRFETTINPTNDLMYHFKTLKAGQLLTEEVGMFFLNRDIGRLHLDKPFNTPMITDTINTLLSACNVKDVEKLLGFMLLQKYLGDDIHTKYDMSKKTLDRRHSQLELLGVSPFESVIELPPLWNHAEKSRRPWLKSCNSVPRSA